MIVGVIGSGSIGPDLAYGFLSALGRVDGAKVYLNDIKEEALQAGVSRIKAYLKKGVSRGKLSAKAAQGIEAKLVPTLQLSDLADCEYVLEAATEQLPIKKPEGKLNKKKLAEILGKLFFNYLLILKEVHLFHFLQPLF